MDSDDINATRIADIETIDEDLTFYLIIIFGVLLPLSLFIILGNGLVIYGVSKYDYLRQQAVYSYVRSLAFSDCVVGISLVPIFYVSIFVTELKTNFFYCLTVCSVVFTSSTISMFHVLVIAIDRYLAIMMPLRYQGIITPNIITTFTVTTWLTAVSFGVLPWLGWRKSITKLTYCNADQVVPFSYFTFFFVASFAVPLALTLALHWKIILVARKQARRIVAVENGIGHISRHVSRCSEMSQPDESPMSKFEIGDTDANSISKRNSYRAILKAIKTTAIVLGVFVACWMPSFIFSFVMEYLNRVSDEIIRSPIVEAFTRFLAFLNSGANPIIYCFRYRDFRNIIKKVFNRR